MKFPWSIDSIPELHSLTPQRRQQVWQRCYWKALRQWRGWLALALAGTCGGAGGWVGDKLGMGSLGGGLGGGIGGLLMVLTIRPVVLRNIRVELGTHCACGYDLRATPERCPECGAAATPGTTTQPQ